MQLTTDEVGGLVPLGTSCDEIVKVSILDLSLSLQLANVSAKEKKHRAKIALLERLKIILFMIMHNFSIYEFILTGEIFHSFEFTHRATCMQHKIQRKNSCSFHQKFANMRYQFIERELSADRMKADFLRCFADSQHRHAFLPDKTVVAQILQVISLTIMLCNHAEACRTAVHRVGLFGEREGHLITNFIPFFLQCFQYLYFFSSIASLYLNLNYR